MRDLLVRLRPRLCRPAPQPAPAGLGNVAAGCCAGGRGTDRLRRHHPGNLAVGALHGRALAAAGGNLAHCLPRAGTRPPGQGLPPRVPDRGAGGHSGDRRPGALPPDGLQRGRHQLFCQAEPAVFQLFHQRVLRGACAGRKSDHRRLQNVHEPVHQHSLPVFCPARWNAS